MKSQFQKLSLDIFDHLRIPYKFVPRPHYKTFVEEIGEYSPYVKRNPTRDHMWDGKSFYLYPNNKFSSTIHELAHWLIATPKQRKLPEFGHGNPSELVRIESEPAEGVDDEATEIQASALGLAIEKHLGFPNWKKSARDHNWDFDKDACDDDRLEYFWVHLGYKGLYDRNGYPIILLNLKGWLRTNPHYAGRH